MRRFADRPAAVVDSELPWDMTDPAEAEPHLRRLEQRLSADPLQHDAAVEALTQVGRAQSLQGRLDDAERTLDQAARALSEDGRVGARLRLLLERGRLLVLRRTPMEARARFLAAWELATDANERYHAVDAAQMLSVVETKKEKITWTRHALEIAESTNTPRVRTWCGPLHVDLGTYHEELLRFPEAAESFRTAAVRFDEVGATRQAAMARCAYGRTLRLMNRADDALDKQRRVEADLRAIGVVDGEVCEEIAECLHLLGNTDEAAPYFQRAFKALSNEQWLVDNARPRLNRLEKLGKAHRDAR